MDLQEQQVSPGPPLQALIPGGPVKPGRDQTGAGSCIWNQLLWGEQPRAGSGSGALCTLEGDSQEIPVLPPAAQHGLLYPHM